MGTLLGALAAARITETLENYLLARSKEGWLRERLFNQRQYLAWP